MRRVNDSLNKYDYRINLNNILVDCLNDSPFLIEILINFVKRLYNLIDVIKCEIIILSFCKGGTTNDTVNQDRNVT